MKLSSRIPEASESFRAQPAILHYKAYLPCCPTRADLILMPIELHDFISRADPEQRFLRHHRANFHDGGILPVVGNPSLFVCRFAIEHAGQVHQHRRRTSRTLHRAVPNAVAILAKISAFQGNMLHHRVSHRSTSPVSGTAFFVPNPFETGTVNPHRFAMWDAAE